MSAKQNDDNTYSINAAELQRWVDGNGRINGSSKRNQTHSDTGVTPHENSTLQTELDAVRQIAEDRQKTIDDLRERLDAESEERRKLTTMLTDQRKPRGLWARLSGR